MMIPLVKKLIKSNFPKFFISSTLNTTLTYGIYVLLLIFFSYTVSYAISYIAGIVFAYLMNRFFVFKSHQGIKSVAMLLFVYLTQYFISILLLWFWVEKINLDKYLAPLVVIMFTFPMTYILSKYVFIKNPV
ncbi:MAG: GtrA family protein [Pseudomonas sp.]|nr:GtrA family protein [Pseudomonas sp.]MDP2244984.1 GtrA family protein [Pseudomonas sp.]